MERQSAVQNVLDKNDVEALNAGVEVLRQANLAGALLARAVTGNGDEIQRNLEIGICRIRSARKIEAPFSTPIKCKRWPRKSRVICRPIGTDAPLYGAAVQQDA